MNKLTCTEWYTEIKTLLNNLLSVYLSMCCVYCFVLSLICLSLADMNGSRVFIPVVAAIGLFIGVGVGVGVFLLLSVLTLVAIILVVVVVRRKVTYRQKGDSKMEDNPYYNKALAANQGNEMEKGLGAGHGYTYADTNVGRSVTIDDFDPYDDAYADCKAQINTARHQAPQDSSTPASVTNIGDLYAVVDKSQKKKAEKEKETVANKEDLYTMPMKKKGKLMETGEGVVESGDVEKREECDEMVGVMYEPKADSESVQQIEGDSKALNVEILYAVVDKSHKKRK